MVNDSPTFDSSDEDDPYARLAAIWTDHFAGAGIRFVPFLSDLLGSLPGLPRVLDIGCGDGDVVSLLASTGVPAFGVDRSPSMIARALETRSGMSFQVADCRTLPFSAESFGLVLMLEMLNDFMDQGEVAEAFTEVLRVLRPGGVLFCDISSAEWYSMTWNKHKWFSGNESVTLAGITTFQSSSRAARMDLRVTPRDGGDAVRVSLDQRPLELEPTITMMTNVGFAKVEAYPIGATFGIPDELGRWALLATNDTGGQR